jgi:hypothetical protein
MEEIGACEALIYSIGTKADGSVKLVLEINPSDQEIISRLMQRFLINEKMLRIGLVGVNHG